MPQLMPMMWMFSVFSVILIILVFVDMYYYNNVNVEYIVDSNDFSFLKYMW